MLDYAANATEYLPGDRMQETFTRRCLSAGLDASTEVAELLGPGGDEVSFWDLAKNNLREGRVRLLFVADLIPPELRRIVEFLQRQMNPAEVLAVEVRQFASVGTDPMRVLVPRVIGQTEQARAAKSSPRSAAKSTPISARNSLTPSRQIDAMSCSPSSGLPKRRDSPRPTIEERPARG